MKNEDKIKKIDLVIKKLNDIISDKIINKDYIGALSVIAASASLQNDANQRYVDDFLEKSIVKLSNIMIRVPKCYNSNKNTVLFYDGFGLDLRGMAITYTRAIVKAGFKLIYVIPKGRINNIPHIVKELKGYDVIIEQINTRSYRDGIDALNNIFKANRPQTAFFYTTPEDVIGALVFAAYKGKVNRIQIDLTDHAFWLGRDSVDFAVECREMGASIAVHERRFNKNQIKRLDILTYINRDRDEESLPFDINKERYIFSGGSLYKTFGDKELLYYKTVRHILSHYKDIYFLYAGFGDASEIIRLSTDFPGRVYIVPERTDFFYIMEHCVFYLNTYPMFGGMMMRYAALAGKLPMTLKHEHDSDGLLINQPQLGIEYDEYKEFIIEIDRILLNDSYRLEKEKKMIGSVITEEVFNRNIKTLILNNETEFEFKSIPMLDTKKFRTEFIERFDIRVGIARCIFRRNSRFLIRYFPKLYLIKKMFNLLSLFSLEVYFDD